MVQIIKTMNTENPKKPLINESDLPQTSSGNSTVGPNSETPELLKKFLEAHNSFVLSNIPEQNLGGIKAVSEGKSVLDGGIKTIRDAKSDADDKTDADKQAKDDKTDLDGKPNRDANKDKHDKDKNDTTTDQLSAATVSHNPVNEFLKNMIDTIESLKKK